MTKWFIGLVVLVVGLYAHAQEYKEIRRTYVNLKNLDLSECLQTFRFLNGNYMDCARSLPLSKSRQLEKLTSSYYPVQSFAFPISGTDLEFYMRFETSGTYSSDERILVAGYYQKVGQTGRLQELSPEHYSPSVFEFYLKQALLQISQNGGWTSARPFIAIPEPLGNNVVEDGMLASIYVARRKMDLRVEDCKKTFRTWEADAWPDEDYWVSDCDVIFLPDHSPIPLRKSDWGSDLQPAATEEISVGAAILSYSASGFTVSFRGEKKWDDVKEDVEAVLQKAHNSVYGYFILRDSELGTLTKNDELLGRLIRRDGLLGISTR